MQYPENHCYINDLGLAVGVGFEPTVRASVQRFSSLMTVVLMRPGRSDCGCSVQHFVVIFPARAVLSPIMIDGSFAKAFAKNTFQVSAS
jgi:hypothetical protein